MAVLTVTGWVSVFEPPPRPWWMLVFNPRVNFHHALENLLERLLREVPLTAQPQELISYRLLEDHLRQHLIQRGLVRPQQPFQFKVTVRGQDALLCAAGP